MNMEYNFKFRRNDGLLWKNIKVVGHSYLPDQDKMVLYFKNGGIREISKWKECEVRLDIDWVLATKKYMESKTGQSIPLSVDAN